MAEMTREVLNSERYDKNHPYHMSKCQNVKMSKCQNVSFILQITFRNYFFFSTSNDVVLLLHFPRQSRSNQRCSPSFCNCLMGKKQYISFDGLK